MDICNFVNCNKRELLFIHFSQSNRQIDNIAESPCPMKWITEMKFSTPESKHVHVAI